MWTMHSAKENSSYTWSMSRPVKLQFASKQKCPVGQYVVMASKANLPRLLNLWMETRHANLLCFLTRTVKKLSLFICSHWCQKNQASSGFPNQQYQTSTKDYVVTRKVNLQDATGKISSKTNVWRWQELSIFQETYVKSESEGTYLSYGKWSVSKTTGK